MPILDYGMLLGPGALYRAQLMVRTVMAWPAEEARRRQYMATVMSMHLAELEEAGANLPDPASGESWEDTIEAIEHAEDWYANVEQLGEWFAEAGGYRTVAAAPGFEAFTADMGSRLGDWFAAGLILALVRRMATHHRDLPGGASINKAVFILERVHLPMVPRNSHDLRRAWKTYKPVAHFCAALFDLFLEAMMMGKSPEESAVLIEEELNEEFLLFLSEAEAYLEFGLRYQPPRTKGQPLLPHDETWTFPEYRPWPNSPRKAAPLDGVLLRAAMEYRAPVPSA
ncbi:hypothetical protein CCC_01619 [Paramagnetospirillum magnetotacticum MS-1]|uniref:Uncharacterized protein n=1 Tax=Paramagnetospirillum magnetotacticum MS-1 TaxID=272627 RepID=A0A0C2YNS4_PARME|nr:hypothetical protein [Paramagnetospirillum magnetotacticum]KIL96753.1 hypothetical protein CCC_01619 [Paramagnetospirillum magnetotacticum MS-1]